MPAPIGDWPSIAWKVASWAFSPSVVANPGTGSLPSRGGGATVDTRRLCRLVRPCVRLCLKSGQTRGLAEGRGDGSEIEPDRVGREAGVGGQELLPRDLPAMAQIEAQRPRTRVGPDERRAGRPGRRYRLAENLCADAASLPGRVHRHATQPPGVRRGRRAGPRVRKDGGAGDQHVVVPAADVHGDVVLGVVRRLGRVAGTEHRVAQRHDLGDGRAAYDDRHTAHHRKNQVAADVSVSDATWSMTTRSRAASSPADDHASRSHGSKASGARSATTCTNRVSCSRCVACKRKVSSRRMTNRCATAFSTAHSARASEGTTRSAEYRVSGPSPYAAWVAATDALDSRAMR